jgi:hypothetical protein
VRRGGPGNVEAVREVRARHDYARVQAGEERRHGQDGAERCHRERKPAPVRERKERRERERRDPEHGRHDDREDVLVVAIDRDDDRPDQEGRPHDCRGHREPSGRAVHAFEQGPLGPQPEVVRSVECEHEHEHDPGEDRVRVQEVDEVPVVVAL